MTLSELRATDFAARWAGLTPDQQAEIGMAALASEFALLVQEDDGSETTAEDRSEASAMADEANNALPRIIQSCFPDIVWFEPAVDAVTHCEDRSYDRVRLPVAPNF